MADIALLLQFLKSVVETLIEIFLFELKAFFLKINADQISRRAKCVIQFADREEQCFVFGGLSCDAEII